MKHQTTGIPPKLALWLMRKFVRDVDSDFAIGDLTEAFYHIVQNRGKFYARCWLWMEALRSLPGFIKNSIYWSIQMILNYIMIAFRNLKKNKMYSIINITGFAVGLATAILTFLFVMDEVRVNTHYEDLDQIYWVKVKGHLGGDIHDWRGCPSAVGPYLKKNFPDIIEAATMVNGSSQYLLKSDNKKFNEKIQFGHFSIFHVFSHQVLKGSIPKDENSNSIVIDDEIAEKYFGSEDPIGKILQLDGKYDLQVAAVFKPMINNATDRFKILAPIKLIDHFWGEGHSRSWENHAFRVYAKGRRNLDLLAFNPKIDDIIIKHLPASNSHPYLYPFKKKYLIDHQAMANVRTYSIITMLLLLVAVINYINLSSAQAIKRAREVGIRKVVGAKKKQIVSQFFFESLIITFIAVVFTSFLLVLLYPFWQKFQYLSIPLGVIFSDFQIFCGVFLIVLVTVMLSSVYPAMILSSFLPKKVLQGDMISGRSGKTFRSVSVVIQFTVSIALIIITITISRQIQFMKDKKLGFETDQIATIFLQGNLGSKYRLLKNEIKNTPGVKNVSLCSHVPGSGGSWDTNSFTWGGKPDNFVPSINENSIDEDYLKTYGIGLVGGENSIQSVQSLRKVLVNQTLAKMMDKESVVGEIITNSETGVSYHIIGVVNDFHHSSVRRKIEPYIFYTDTERMPFYHLSFKFEPAEIQGILEKVEKLVASIETEYPFSYTFLDQGFGNWYSREERLQFTVQSFGLIAILVSCLGLFGMTTFVTHRRTREIGIRKALGANTKEIILMLLQEFSKWVVIANVIGWPIAYLYLRNWINNYDYRISLGLDIFVISGAIALLLAVVTVIGRVYRAASKNPGISLRTD